MTKRTFIGTLLCVAMLFCAGSAFAAGEDVSVSVDRRSVDFSDQTPIIENDRVLVPIRGVFEAMGANVLWDPETRQVTVFSFDNLDRLVLTVDSKEFCKLTFKSLFDVETEYFTSEVAPKIVNGRTMVPIYLVADYMNNEVKWDGKARHVTFTSKRFLSVLDKVEGGEEVLNNSLPKLSISTDAKDAKVDEYVTVKVNLSNSAVQSDKGFFGASSTVYYDNTSFEYDGYKIYSNGIETTVEAAVDNGAFWGDSVKLTYLFNPEALITATDETIAELFFKVKDEKGGEFKLSDRLTSLGYDTMLLFATEAKVYEYSKADQLYIDTTPVFVGK